MKIPMKMWKNWTSNNMKYLIIAILLSSCAGTKLDQKRAKVLDCTKELIDMDSGTKDSYDVCKDLYSRTNK